MESLGRWPTDADGWVAAAGVVQARGDIRGRGGRMRAVARPTTRSPSTRTSPTAQALSGPWSAVSKSMATNGRSGGGTDGGRGRVGNTVRLEQTGRRGTIATATPTGL
jgi:hypothetical protein